MSKTNTKNTKNVVEKSVEDRYKKKTPHEHILDIPDTYIGSIVSDKMEMWVLNNNNTMEYREIDYLGGLFKIFDELIVNCRDQTVRTNECNVIKVNIDKKNNTFTFYNNGSKIPNVIHKEHNVYVAKMIFAELLTSENYDKDEKKTVGGKNGYGAKLANIFSEEFHIETFDDKRRLYTLLCKKNMYDTSNEKIKTIPITNKNYTEPYVKIVCKPDCSRFSIKEISDDMIALFKKRVYDISACTPKHVKVYLNDELIKISNFKDYITDMYYLEQDEDDDPENSDSEKKQHKLLYEEYPRWKIGVMYDPNSGYRHISYVNGICTFQGGSHVNYIMDQIVKGVNKFITTKYKDIVVRPSQIKDNITLFVDCVIENPSFNSQTKEYLTNKVADYGSKCEISEDFIKKLCKTGIVKDAVEMAKLKQNSELKKSDGKKVGRIYNIPKLIDAINAGGRNSKDNTLILTEGDSAKPFALAGLSVLGNENYGVFPLKGKLLNVRDASPKKLAKNEEIMNIKAILGLKHDKKYTNVNELRYGHILILTDQDLDGYHIKGLLMNFINFFWPSLSKIDGFIQSLSTPIIKAWKASDVKKANVKSFYTITEYERWKEENKKTAHQYKIKYFKGLGTSSAAEAKECFTDFYNRVIKYNWGLSKNNEQPEDKEESDKPDQTEELEDDDSDVNINDASQKALLLAFSKKKRPDRKRWLINYDKDVIIENNITNVSYVDFINKEMKHFSNHDNVRSIPCIIDGLKPTQRKVLYGCIKKGIFKEEIKVVQLGGYIGDKTNYHHGDMSLYGTIIKMAQNYPGSNNVNLLEPLGSFGTRRNNKAASPRYINTRLSRIVTKIFRPEDNLILTYVDDDGTLVEPETYIPIVPFILCNGIEGIGTGFSTKIPPYNMIDIINNVRRMIAGNPIVEMTPYYRGFRGKITKESNVKFICSGSYEILDRTNVKIKEIPIEWAIDDYLTELSKYIVQDNVVDPKRIIKSYVSKPYLNKVSIVVEFIDGALLKLMQSNGLEKLLKLSKPINLTNMNTNTVKQKVHKYSSVDDILTDYYNYRLDAYVRRKELLLKKSENELNLIKYKVMFLEYVLSGKIVIFNNNRSMSKESIIIKVKELGFPELSNTYDSPDKSYNYITSILLFALSEEELEKLKKQLEIETAAFEKYKNTPIINIWLQELDELEKEYNSWVKEIVDDDAKVGQQNTKKKQTRSTRGAVKKSPPVKKTTTRK